LPPVEKMKLIRYTQEMVDEFIHDGYWTDETFYDFYHHNADSHRDQEALVDSTYRLTWAQAKRLVDGIAQTWIQMGLSRDARIIIQAPNSVYGFLARIAAERAGLIALTVYPYLREMELEYFVQRTQSEAVVICHLYRKFNYLEMYKGLQDRFPFLKKIFLFDDTVPAEAPPNTYSLAKLSEESLLQPIDQELLISRRFDPRREVGLLTSTSGTTGLPKLVEWPIASRIATSKGRIALWKLTQDDITMAIAPHAGGAAGTLTYFAAPLVGAKTVLLEEFDPEKALALIEKEKVTAIGVVPTHLVRMLEADSSRYDLSSLRFIRSAGGYLSPQLAEEAERFFKAVITSDLGTQDVGSVSGCSVEDPKELRRRTVGRMLPGNRVILKDEQGNPVPDGEPGILWFRGPHAPAGYYRDPELTASVFDPEGWTTTGDIIKLEEGFLWMLGRAKDMIIRGGQNIYPAEIEGLLNGHPKVASAAIVGYPDKEMGERACAFVVPKTGQTFTFEEIKSFLKGRKISAYKLPERLEVVSALPMVGDSGKIDKKVLKARLEEKVKSEKS
jgi:2,3-dihydroxybenzoate-AMP ligase